MKKKTVLALTLTLIASLLVLGTAFAGGPAEKATGNVGNSANDWRAEFNAHDEVDGRPAKGTMSFWNDIVGREIELEIVDVAVIGDEAWFTAIATSDSWVGHDHYRFGHLFYVHVEDGGSPGTNDYIGWCWDDTPVSVCTGNWWQVTDGNLVVHTYD